MKNYKFLTVGVFITSTVFIYQDSYAGIEGLENAVNTGASITAKVATGIKTIVGLLCMIGSYIGMAKANSKSHVEGHDAVSAYMKWGVSIFTFIIAWIICGYLF